MFLITKKLFRKTKTFVVDFPQNNKNTTIALKSLSVGCPTLVFGYSQLTIKKLPNLPYQKQLCEHLEHNTWLLVLLIVWPLLSVLLVSIGEDVWRNMKKNKVASEVDLLAILQSIDRILGSKLNRFGEFAKNMPENLAQNNVFKKITQPDRQIEKLLDNLFNVLMTATGDRSLSIVLAEIDDDAPVDWVYYVPDDARPPDKLLEQEHRHKTLFSYAAKKQNGPEVISDISDHLARTKNKGVRKYVSMGVEESEFDVGYIACFPFYHKQLQKVVYCLSIKSERPELIARNEMNRYKFIVEEFAKRLLLEYTLQYIKEKAK